MSDLMDLPKKLITPFGWCEIVIWGVDCLYVTYDGISLQMLDYAEAKNYVELHGLQAC